MPYIAKSWPLPCCFMASLALKAPENLPGEFFVDLTCIDCDLCRQTAPGLFARKYSGNEGYTFVARQPCNTQEEYICLEAMRACPVDAIGQN